MRTVLVVGGGASGLMASYIASLNNNNVILLEKNEKLGKKIYITGKGRCNVTNSVEPSGFLNFVCTNPKFLFSSIYSFSPQDLIKLLNDSGLDLVFERGNRVFPKSNHASDVIKTFEKMLLKNNVDIRLNTSVKSLIIIDGVVKGVKTTTGDIYSDSVILCTGGVSYPLTGSSGDGFLFAKECGHEIVKLKPALCGLELKGNDYLASQGLTLKNVSLKVYNGQKEIYNDFGEMLFTHFGVSGPIILSCSSVINKFDLSNIKIVIDLKPALSNDVLDKRLQREFSENSSKEIHNVLRALLPQSLIDVVLLKSHLPQSKKCATITKEERNSLLNILKSLTFEVKGLRNIDEAIVTSGGVSVKNINAKTMESKLIKGLYFAGEMIDVDAFTGGFNLQIAFSTGYIAGKNA